MKKLLLLLLAAVLVFGTMGTSRATLLFEDDFESYADSESLRSALGTNWYGGRFEQHDGGTVKQDLHIDNSLSGSDGQYAWIEDEAGLLFNINTAGSQDVMLSFDWRMNIAGNDEVVAGYYVGDLGSFPDTGTRDFVQELGGHDAVVDWWQENWHQFLRSSSDSWQTLEVLLPAGEESVWVAFWLDNGEDDFGAIDNVSVTNHPIPEPIALLLLGTGLLGLAGLRRRLEN